MHGQSSGQQVQERDVSVLAVGVLEVKLSCYRIGPAFVHSLPGLVLQ